MDIVPGPLRGLARALAFLLAISPLAAEAAVNVTPVQVVYNVSLNAASLGETPDVVYLAGTHTVGLSVDLSIGHSGNVAELPDPVPIEIRIVAYAAGVDQGVSVLAGAGGFPRAKIATPTTHSFTFDLSGAGFRDFAATQHHLGRTLRVRVVVDPGTVIAETNEADNALTNTSNFRGVPLSGGLGFGLTKASFTAVAATPALGVSPCSTGQVRLSSLGGGLWEPSLTEPDDWDDATFACASFPCAALTSSCATTSLAALGGGGSALDLVPVGTLDLGTVNGDLGWAEVAVDVELRPPLLGGGAFVTVDGTASVTLPPGLTAHGARHGRPIPRGSSTLDSTFEVEGTGPYGDLAVLGALAGTVTPSDTARFLHSTDLPFYFEFSQITFSEGSASGRYTALHYVYDLPFHQDDQRHSDRDGVRSNDRRFSRDCAPPPGLNFVIDPTGLSSANLCFAESATPGNPPAAGTHFPRLAMRWGDFNADVVDGVFVDQQTITDYPVEYEFAQSTDCELCPSGGGTKPLFNVAPREAVPPGNTVEALGSDGAVMARLDPIGTNPRWGRWDGAGGSHRFERTGDDTKTGVIFLPGFHAQGTGGGGTNTQPEPVARYLLGMRQAVNSGSDDALPGIHFGLENNVSRRGSHVMAGVTVGPTFHSDQSAGGQPTAGFAGQLLGGTTSTEIGFGGASPDYEPVPSNDGTKYVVRAGGVTGVFNSNVSSGSPLDLTVYGYDLPLHRFAFRQISNRLDTTSWIDGAIAVPAKGSFGVTFSSLALECTGDLGGGHVDRDCPAWEGAGDGDGDGILNENCGQSLGAWKAKIDLHTMAFVETDPDAEACAADDRRLEVGMSVDVRALEDPLGLVAQWSPTVPSEPLHARVSGRTNHVLDQPDVVGAPGFDFALAEEAALASTDPPDAAQSQGWFQLTGDIGVPFWQALGIFARLENQSTTVQAQSLVVGLDDAGEFDPDAANTANVPEMEENPLDATYTWGSTGFGIGLPVFYEAGNHALNTNTIPPAPRAPRFLGVTQEANLRVLSIAGGIDFITPERTKISFGASADFEKLRLQEIDLHVDLNDPASVQRIDSFLAKPPLSLGGAPVATLVNIVTTPMRELNDIADAGFDPLLEGKIHALVTTTIGADDGPLDTAATALGRVQSIPGVVAAEVADSLNELVDRLVQPLTADVAGLAADVYNAAPDLIYDVQDGSGDIDALRALADKVGRVARAVERVDGVIEGLLDRIEQAGDQIAALQALLDEGALADVTNALTTLTVQFSASGSDFALCDDLAFCNAPATPVGEGICTLTGKLGDVADALDALDFGQFAAPLSAVAAVDTSGIAAAARDIDEMRARLVRRLTDIVNAINDPCGALGVGNFLDDATFLDEARLLFEDVASAMTNVTQAVDDMATLVDDALDLQVKASVLEARRRVGGVLAVLRDVEDTMRQTAEDPLGLRTGIAQGIDGDDIRSRMNEAIQDVLNDPSWSWCDHDPGDSCEPNGTFVARFVNELRDDIDQAIGSAAAIASAELAALTAKVPHPSKDELVEFVVDLVMNTPPVEAIDTLVHEQLSELVEDLNSLVMDVFDQVNQVVGRVTAAVSAQANAAIREANAVVENNLPIRSVETDGFALIQGNELERLHVGAEWAIAGASADEESNPTSFNAALDVTRWTANGKGACGVLLGADAGARLDATISTRNLRIAIGEDSILAKRIYLGFNLQKMSSGDSIVPVGVFGGILTSGTLKFEAFELYDIGFGVGVGAVEAYLGAAAGGRFDQTQIEAAFLVGRTCNLDVLQDLDPQVGDFITLPVSGFKGGYARGAATFPIVTGSCLSQINGSADVGAWVLVGPPVTVGGLVGGGISGQAACIVALRGEATLFGEKSGGNFRFRGELWGAGGVGSCEPGTWTSVSASRNDTLCVTFDGVFACQYRSGWDVDKPKFSGPH